MKKTIALLFITIFLTSTYSIMPKFTFAQSSSDNSWTIKAPMPQALTGGGAVSVNGKIYFMCGSSNYVYDPTTDNWTSKSPMPTPRTVFGIAEYQDKIYVIGGTNSDGTNANVNEVYDPSNDTWTILAPMPTARGGIDANVVNGKIYVMGGENYSGYINLLQAFPSNEIYNIANNSWSNGKPMPIPVYAYSSAVANNKIYYLGGATHLDPTNLTQIYDPQQDSWIFGSNFSIPMITATAGATTGVYAPQRIYLFGGVSTDLLRSKNNTQVYDPASNTWTNGTAMPTRRSGMAIAEVDDLIYIIGGNINFLAPTASNEQYKPFGYQTTPLPTSTAIPELSAGVATIVILITTALAVVFAYKKRHL